MTEKTVFKFSELNPRAKDYARSKLYERLPRDEWWDHTFDDADRAAELLGIHIGRHGRNTQPEQDIEFSGFYSQGDGASFRGRYYPVPDAITAIKQYAPQDEVLHAIAKELTVLQVTSRLNHGAEIEATIDKSGSYSHSRTMTITSCEFVDGSPFFGPSPTNDQISQLLDLMRRFADWIYRCLEEEYSFLTSTEVLDEQLAEQEFDEDGVML